MKHSYAPIHVNWPTFENSESGGGGGGGGTPPKALRVGGAPKGGGFSVFWS